MATFKVGQRVRIIRFRTHPHILGCEGVIVEPREITDWLVRIDGLAHVGESDLPEFHYSLYEWQLAPLTDRAADAFLARMKKLGNEPINEAPKVTVKVDK